MEINPLGPGTHICIDTMAVNTKDDGRFVVFFALDVFADKIISFEIMPDGQLRDYKDFILLLSRKENLNNSVLILDFEDKTGTKEKILEANPILTDIICDSSLCHYYTKAARSLMGERFGLKS